MYPDQIKLSHYSHPSYPQSFMQEGQDPTPKNRKPLQRCGEVAEGDMEPEAQQHTKAVEMV